MRVISFITSLSVSLFISATAFGAYYTGVGITIQQEKKDFLITEVIADGPAERAGVLAGDFLVSVDGNECNGKKLDDVVKWLRGDAGTKVVMLVVHPTEGRRELTVIRDVFEVKCFLEGSYSFRFDGGSFARLSGFLGSDYVNLSGNDSYVSGYVKGEFVNLNVSTSGGNYTDISGYIRGTYVRWSGFSTNIGGYQNCIR